MVSRWFIPPLEHTHKRESFISHRNIWRIGRSILIIQLLYIELVPAVFMALVYREIKLLIIERVISWNLTTVENENALVTTPERSTVQINMLMWKLLACFLVCVNFNFNFSWWHIAWERYLPILLFLPQLRKLFKCNATIKTNTPLFCIDSCENSTRNYRFS